MKTLLPHQLEDAQFLASKKFAGCFSGMGSGKTLTALEAVRLNNPDLVIIIAPPIALRMWQEEFEAYGLGKAQIVKTGKTKIDPEADALIMSYEIATKRKDELVDLAAGVLICDEAHALFKVQPAPHPSAPVGTSKRTKAILGAGGLCASVDAAWMLTGTPITRHADDLYPFLCRADLDGLKAKCGSAAHERFMLRYCITQRKRFPGMQRERTMVVGSRNGEELNSWLYDEGLAVRRELKDVWDAMPPLTHNSYFVPLVLTPELKRLLKEYEKKSVSEIERDLQNKEEHLATIRRELGIAKVKATVDTLVERIESGSGPVLVGAWHTQVIDLLVKKLAEKDIRVAALDGRTSAHGKADLQDAFNAGRLDVLVGQIAAMGVSLNLQQGGNMIVVAESDFSPAVMDQFYARLHRMGQSKHVHVDTLLADTPLDLAIQKIAKRKSAFMNQVNHQEAV